MKKIRSITNLLIAASLCSVLMTNTAWSGNGRTEICYSKFLNQHVLDKLASIAYAEARKKKAWVRDYKSLIAIEILSYRHENRPVYAIRFSPYACNDRGTDGGGFDIEVDRKTLKVIDSRHSIR
jgi:hypothetical protein